MISIEPTFWRSPLSESWARQSEMLVPSPSLTGAGACASAALREATRALGEPAVQAAGALSEPDLREQPAASTARKTQPTHRVRATDRS